MLILLAMLLAAAGQNQGQPAKKEPARKALAHIRVSGITDFEGAKVILINAKGTSPSCRTSVVLPIAAPPKSAIAALLSHVPFYPDGQAGSLVDLTGVDSGCWCSDPNAGLAVLARGRSVAYFGNQNLKMLCPLDLGPRTRDTMAVDMRPRRDVPVDIWTADGLKGEARDDILNADWILDKELAGVTLRPAFRKKIGPYPLEVCNNDDADCCERVTESANFQPGAINIYYGFGKLNNTCPVQPVIFIHEVPILGDVAHELGHALGLSKRDNDPEVTTYDHAHTTGIDPFGCDNVMWEHSQFLKDELSAGQAFWLSNSCTSFLAASQACLSCSSDPNSPSPCPRFSVGKDGRPSRCKEAAQPVRSNTLLTKASRKTPLPPDRPEWAFKSSALLRAELTARYRLLKAHARHRRDLQLGSSYKGDFVDRWSKSFQIILPGEP